jgi:hypothetical protein
MSDIVVENEFESEDDDRPAEVGGALVSWIMDKVDGWRTHRDTQHAGRWDEYYRIWRGLASEDGKDRKTQRSKIVAPATMQAVDSTVAEIEEAIFGREQWMDLSEDYVEGVDKEQRDEMLSMRDILLERMNRDNVPTACAKSFLIGAIYGTAVGKINTGLRERVTPNGKMEEVYVELLPLEPYEFVPDPTTDTIEDMLGMAHETVIPYHKVLKAKKEGRFRDVYCGAWEGERPGDSKDENQKLPQGDCVYITEWHGLVPAKYLTAVLLADGKVEPDKTIHEELEKGDPEDYLVEAIVTIGNKGTLLSAKKNEFLNEDRCFISYQHDRVPNYFWGRGVPEKGYNPQKALDAELRSRLDAMGLVAHPMVAGDITRLPRGMNLTVYPGKFWPTTGNPNEILTPFQFGQLNPATFNQADNMERMVQMATGAMDPGGQYNANQQSASNTALNASAFIKRARRTMQNIERQWMQPLVQKAMLRYMQFDPQTFQYDPVFSVRGTMGIMAREFEQQQLIQVLGIMKDTPMGPMIMKAVVDNTSSPHKKDMMKALDQFLAPPSEEAAQKQKQMEELQMRAQMAQTAEVEAKAEKAKAEAGRAQAQGYKAKTEADFMDEELSARSLESAINLREVEAFEMQNWISQTMQQLRAFDLAIKAKVADAQVTKTMAEAKAIQTGTRVAPKKG